MKDQSVGKDTIRITFSHIITASISLLSIMILSRYRTLEEYGTYSQILIVTSLFSSIFALGLPNSISYFLSRANTEEEKSDFLSIYYTLSTVIGIIIGIVTIITSSLIIEYFNNPYLKSFIYIIAVYPWTRVIISSLNRVLIIYSKTKFLIIYQVSNGLSLLLIVGIAILLELDFSVYMLMFIVTEIVYTILVFFIVKRITKKLRFLFQLKFIKIILYFSIPIGLASIIGTINKELDKLMIGYFFNTEDLAIYTNAGVELPFAFFAASFTAVILPIIVVSFKEGKVNEAIELWKNTMFLSFFILCFLSLGIITFAPDVITLLYSEKYLPGTEVFRVYTAVMMLRFTYFGTVLNAIGKTKFILLSSLFSLILNLILNYIFYLSFGFVGPAYATFISILCMLLVQLIATSKNIKYKIKDIVPWMELSLILILNILLGFAFYYFKSINIFNGKISSLLESMVFAIVWGILILLVYYKKIRVKWKNLELLR